ncbi:MAG: lycopene cyclase [Flavobacterium sp.]|nr:MAG: lycopene cyclase [Flavobacterium sp.]
MKHYDYIFTGAGLAALMTVYRMTASGKFSGKSILLIDPDRKKSNDRTWSFWETDGGEFDDIVSRQWNSALFADVGSKQTLDLSPYRYKTIRGSDFYDFVLKQIRTESNIDFVHDKVTDFDDVSTNCVVKTENAEFTCGKIINSIYNPELAAAQEKYPVLQQHFIGWFVKTKEPVFNPYQLTFMDFSVEQKGNTRFMYVLPFSENEALVEYTLFSKDLLRESEYESEIESYLKTLGASDFIITEKERGSIPMTAYKFWKNNTKNIIHIGSAGGWTKASTGFTFKNTVKKSASLAEFMQTNSDLRQFHHTNRFWFYDLLLLDILSEKNDRGHEIFSAMFADGKSALILKFLDEETSIAEDLRVILKCPKRLFLSALAKRIFR